jgi:uncharacterized protein YpiB (UPF0302 family)
VSFIASFIGAISDSWNYEQSKLDDAQRAAFNDFDINWEKAIYIKMTNATVRHFRLI